LEGTSCGFTTETEPFLLRGWRFLWEVGCSCLAAARKTGGVTGAQEASELMGCFIQVATVEESRSCWPFCCLLRCFLAGSTGLGLDRLLDLAWVVTGGTMASKPEEVPSSPNGTHSVLRLLATIIRRILSSQRTITEVTEVYQRSPMQATITVKMIKTWMISTDWW
jgi:hypothetical protein